MLTKAYGLCDYVIHVVGSVFDAETGKTPRFLGKWMKKHNICSSSRVRTLESCYREIVRIIREHPDIKNVAVPIVGSGEYGFPFKMAVKTAIAGIGMHYQNGSRMTVNSLIIHLRGFRILSFLSGIRKPRVWIRNIKRLQLFWTSIKKFIKKRRR